MFFLREEFFPDARDGFRFGEGEHGAYDFGEAEVKLVLGEFFEDVGAEHVALDVVVVLFVVDRYARVGAEGFVGVKFAERHVFLCHFHDGAGCHNVACRDIVELQEVLDHAVFLLLEHALFGTDGDHG